MRYYAGIGARDTPESILEDMSLAARYLELAGWKLRSGGAAGADTAFENGVRDVGQNAEIFLPWKGFRKNQSPKYGSTLEARTIAKQFHPNWANVSCAGRDFHARNVYQILGEDLVSHSKFVLCWTEGGKIKGGTGQALRMAEHFKIPVINFGNLSTDEVSDKILEQIEQHRNTK